jgi:predicted membrane-bound mannosyltransferase
MTRPSGDTLDPIAFRYTEKLTNLGRFACRQHKGVDWAVANTLSAVADGVSAVRFQFYTPRRGRCLTVRI